jgi:hypothetical protein
MKAQKENENVKALSFPFLASSLLKELVGDYWKGLGRHSLHLFSYHRSTKNLLGTIGLDGATIRFTCFHSDTTDQQRACWWLLARCSPLPIPNREVKPGTADDTWIKPGKVGSRHIHYTKTIPKGWSFFVP